MQARDPLEDVFPKGRIGQRPLGARGADESRRHRVDGDAVLAPLHGQALGEMGDGSLGHAVDRFRRQRHEARLRAQADDATVALPDHHPAGSLAGEEDALHVDRDC